MPIEIKELHIRVRIEEGKETFRQSSAVSKAELESLKSSLIKECTTRVLEKIKEREER